MTWHVPPALAASATNERPGRGRARGIAHRAIERTERMRRVLPHAPKFRSQDAAPAACRRDVDEGRWGIADERVEVSMLCSRLHATFK
jgi:hypothetical protein